MRQYINPNAVPLSVAVFLAVDDYDYDDDVNTISTTTLIKPLRQTILAARVPPSEAVEDISARVPSSIGSAIHNGIENAWRNKAHSALRSLGYPQRMIDRITINPDPDQVTDDMIPIYLETRASRAIKGWKVSGKFDFVGEGRLQDFKSTSVYSWTDTDKAEDYRLQGSIYRWLNPKIITQDSMAIQFIFTDWSAVRARTDNSYPSHRTMERTLALYSVAETEHYIARKLEQISHYWDAPEEDIPLCTDAELWRRDPQYKYYKNPEKTQRSTKNFDNPQDAYARMAQDGHVGKVVTVPGQVNACKYCPAFPVCSQKDDLIANGSLIL